MKNGTNSIGEHFRNNFIRGKDQADGSIILNCGGISLLRNERNEGALRLLGIFPSEWN